MGDSILKVSRPELNEVLQMIKGQADATSQLLESLFLLSQKLSTQTHDLELKLTAEAEKKQETEKALEVAKNDISELKSRIPLLETKLLEVTKKAAGQDGVFEKMKTDKEEQIKQLTEVFMQNEQNMKGLKYLRENTDAFKLGSGMVEEPCSALMLPDGRVVIADTLKGLFIYSANTELIRNVTSKEWKWPQGLVFNSEKNVILVTMVLKKSRDRFERVIGEFSVNLDYLGCIDGPPDAANDNVTKEKLTKGGNDELFLTVADATGSSIYKYDKEGWFLVICRQGTCFSDLQVLRTSGSGTELIVVDSKMGYVHKLEISGTTLTDQNFLPSIENPGAICVDARGQFFMHDIQTGRIEQFDTKKFKVIRTVGIVNSAVFSLTANDGYLGVALREAKMVQIFRYLRPDIHCNGYLD